jgi:hypothetical protein
LAGNEAEARSEIECARRLYVEMDAPSRLEGLDAEAAG